MISNRDAGMAEMDTLLRRASVAFAYPAAPDIAGAVASRLRPPEQRRTWSFIPQVTRPRLAAAFAAALVAGVVVVLSVPQSRTALAEFFGLSHVRVTVETPGPMTPTPLAREVETFASPITLLEAQARVDFSLRFPHEGNELLEPESILFVDGYDEPIIVFTYEDFDFYQTRQGFFGKEAPDQSLIHEIEFDGRAAYWIDQGGHIATLFDERGNEIRRYRRTIERATLLWEDDGVTYRLETLLSQAEALRVAASLR